MRHGNLTQIWEKNDPGGGKSKSWNTEVGADSGCKYTDILMTHLPEVLFQLHNGFTGHQALF